MSNVWNALPNFRGDSQHSTWLYRIAVNTALLHRRKQKSSEPLTEIADQAAGAQQILEEQDFPRLLRAAIAELPSRTAHYHAPPRRPQLQGDLRNHRTHRQLRRRQTHPHQTRHRATPGGRQCQALKNCKPSGKNNRRARSPPQLEPPNSPAPSAAMGAATTSSTPLKVLIINHPDGSPHRLSAACRPVLLFGACIAIFSSLFPVQRLEGAAGRRAPQLRRPVHRVPPLRPRAPQRSARVTTPASSTSPSPALSSA